METQVIEHTEPTYQPLAPDTTTDRRKTRWVVFAGQEMPDAFRKEFAGAQIGGINLGHDFKTLHLSKGLLRRCEITPMVVGYDYLNPDMLGGDYSKVRQFQEFNETTRQVEVRYAYECLPGDELESIIQSMQGPFDIGIREVVSLRGSDVRKPGDTEPSLARQMQLAIFPEWDSYVRGAEFFPTTSALREYLLSRRDVVGDDVREVIDVILESNDQNEIWETEKLSEKGILVKAPVSAEGRVHSWNRDDLRRFDHTGLNREEFLMQKKDAPTSEVSAADFAEMKNVMAQAAPAIAMLAQMAVNGQKPATETDIAPGTPIHVGEKAGQIVAKKGGGYYAVRFDDGSEGNYRPNQMTFSTEKPNTRGNE